LARKPAKQDSGSGNSDAAICARVRQLVAEHSLSVLASRTGTPVTSVHRYANGGRVPAGFCAALVAEMSVNPGWLLSGDGAVYATDMRGTSAAMATGMRELMDAMNAASRLSLGRLGYRKDLGLLRDLSMAAAAHSQLREKLGGQINPVARQWLKALHEALQKRDRERAQDILDALERLMGFSDDPALRHDVDRHRALHEYVMGRRSEAADLQRRNLLARLAQSGQVTEGTLSESYNLCAALSGLGRVHEGRRFAEATLVLRGKGPSWPIERMLRCILGLFELGLGNVERALALITEAYVNRSKFDEGTSGFLMPTVLLRTGTASIASVLRDYPVSVQMAVEVVRHALFRENIADLKQVLDGLERAEMHSLGAVQLFMEQARWLLAVLQGNRRRPSREQLEALEAPLLQTPVLGEIEVAVLRCQRARLERSREAANLVLHAQQLIDKVPAEITLDHLVRGIHARNVLELVPRRAALARAAVQAREFLAQMVGHGIGMFRELAAQSQPEAR